MKKALLLLGIMSFTYVYSNDNYPSTTKTSHINNYNEAVTFIENGILFHVFLNGDFEFEKPRRNAVYYDYNGYRFRRNGIRIYRDYKGRIKRIGRNYIRYDYRGNVTRIGNIRLHYRNGLLRKVGDLRVTYNYWGDPYFYGNVHRNHYPSNMYFSLNFGPIYNYNDRFFYNRTFKNNYRKYREDKHYYYYKAKPNVKTGNRGKIIKRRKSVIVKRDNNNVKRRTSSKQIIRQKSRVHNKRNKTYKRSNSKRKRETIKRKIQKIDTNKRYEKRRS